MKNYLKFLSLLISLILIGIGSNLVAMAPKKPHKPAKRIDKGKKAKPREELKKKPQPKEERKERVEETLPADVPKSLRANVAAQPRAVFRKLRDAEQCQTDWDNPSRKSSKFYRKLVFRALKAQGYEHPHIMMVINDPKECNCFHAHYVKDKKGLLINLNEKELDKLKYGFRVGCAFHEVRHFLNQDLHDDTSKDDPNYYKIMQKQEKLADKAILHCGCYQCAFERAEEILKRNEGPHKHLTMKDLEKMNWDQISKLIEEVEPQSLARKAEHPLDIERALRIYRYGLKMRVDKKICEYHKKKIEEQKKKLAKIVAKAAKAKIKVAGKKKR